MAETEMMAMAITAKRLEKNCCKADPGEGIGVIITGLVISSGAVSEELCNVVVGSLSAPQPESAWLGEHPIAVTCFNPARTSAALIRSLVSREAMALASCMEAVAMLKSTRTAPASSCRRAEIDVIA